MREDRASRTAEYMAMHRAAHQLLDAPTILDDPFASIVIDAKFASALQANPESTRWALVPSRRAFLAARSRYAEDQLARAVEQGCQQYVVLGAGFDTFFLRCGDHALRVFEIDHPATQATKLARLLAAGVSLPTRASFYAADFTRQSLSDILRDAGVDPARRVFVSWLGVAQYLPHEIVRAALAEIASFSPHVEIVFDYTLHYDLQSEAQRLVFNSGRRLAELESEPFRSMFTPNEVVGLCGGAGFSAVRTASVETLNALYCARAESGLKIDSINQLAFARAVRAVSDVSGKVADGSLAELTKGN
jgi:methyltransferase (TIGR00027 family)